MTGRLKAAKSYEEARAVFLEKEAAERHVDTLVTLASIRNSIDTRDAFYDGEEKFWNEAGPELEAYLQDWTKAMLDSPFRPRFAGEYGQVMFLNAEIALKTFSPEIIPELQQENDLTQEYEKLLASAQIPFEGQSYTLSQLTPFKSDPDDARRLAAWKAEGQWYKDNQPRLDQTGAVEIGTKPVCRNPRCITRTEGYLPPLVRQIGGVDCCAFCDGALS